MLTYLFRYVISDSGRNIKIKESNVKEFYSPSQKFWYRKIIDNKGHEVLMRVLERGPISLYEAVVLINKGTATNWYATKNSDTAIFIKTDAFVIISGTRKGKNAFMTYLADNKSIHDRYIADDNPPIEEIQNLVHIYNAGREYPAPIEGQ